MRTFPQRFAQRTAVVTGGASGLGLDVARRITEEGGKAVLWDLDAATLENARSTVSGAHTVQVDIASWDSVETALSQTVEAVGRVDLLVNSAGITGPTQPVTEFPLDGWRTVIEINLTGTFHACRALAPLMVEGGYGRIVNVASVAGKEGNPNASAYSASKAGVIGFTKSLAKELATKGVLVNAVTPAVFDSPLLAQMPQSQIDFMRSKIPMGRLGLTEETTAMVCFLLSEECSFSTGAVFDTSGGRTTY